ncbi:hypothetical protein MA16_Dca000193 [Dendrobium catenatum]|uniref:Uncharacterized protein n=1 Tax=Dendrobium catenatum TaxID=906689 RepID=A0A2I0WT60_9ASPA|nr:hypothetical protein MA16_Dca000193 [Dendrobium catenatum]
MAIVGGRGRSKKQLKDRSLMTKVRRNVVGEKRWSERPLFGDGGRKGHSRWTKVVRKIVV